MPCGDCKKFKGPGVACGGKYLDHRFTPVSAKVGPCMNDFEQKENEPVTAVPNLGQLLKEKLDAKKQSCSKCDRLVGGHCPSASGSFLLEIKQPEVMGGSCKLYLAKKIESTDSKSRPYQLHLHLLPVEDLIPCNDYTVIVSREGVQFEYTDGTPITDQVKVEYLKKRHFRPGKTICNKLEVPTTKKEETTMSNAIIRLADSQFTKEVADFGGLNVDLREALQDMQAAQKKEAAIAAAKEVMGVLNAAEIVIEENVSEIRSARNTVEAAKTRIADINRAKAYGLETNNFVPLGILVGHVGSHRVENKELLKVPTDWTPKAAPKSE